MAAKIISGKEISAHIKEQVKEQVQALTGTLSRAPGLAVILAGDNPASKIYVENKKKACAFCGIKSFEYLLPQNVSEAELLALIEKLNGNGEVDGILCQLPLPEHINENNIIEAISPEKDVDGFHPVNAGRLLAGRASLLPCTPAGIIEMLKYENIPMAGKRCAVVGRSSIVGKPAALLLLQNNATVTVCHSKTENLRDILLQSDIVIAAVGHPHLITGDMIKEGAVVIDVGINRLPNGKITGDVDFESVEKKAAAISPVPGGVGPMTISLLMRNTLTAAAYLAQTEKKKN